MEKENLTAKDINENIETHINDITREFKAGLELLKQYPKSVSIFGSARASEENPHYKQAEELAGKIVKELGYAIITGGGPGIMLAANKGAKKNKGSSVGLNITLPREQHGNGYTTEELKFDYFFTRKTILTFAAEAYVFFPGGYGTLDELFGIITLIQTHKIPSVPVILVGKDFWKPLRQFLKIQMTVIHHTINTEDMNLFVITDNLDTVIRIIKEAPVSEWWKMMD